ncbi:MAG: MFS transporter [Myxococcales bacterium]|nr:MFS transporter [Myxococcales bacterium]MCB9645960.1 MFS transporter [Deltaproteobacteria bacterium]
MSRLSLFADLEGPDRRVILILCLVLFTSGADMLIITPILPTLARDLGVGVDTAGLWVTAYATATAGFALIFGPISDRFGRRPILLAGLFTLTLGTVACGLSSSFITMVGARLLAGAGAGLLVTSTTCFVGDHFAPRQRAVAMGWVMSGFFLSLIFSVPLGSALAAAVGWSRMFFVYAVFATGVGAALLFLLPRPRYEQRSTTLSVRSAFVGYRALLLDRRAVGVLLMSATIGASMTMFMVYASPWLEREYAFDTATRGLVYAVGGPAAIFGGPLAGRLSNRFGRVRMVVAGSLLMALMQVIMPTSFQLGQSLGAVVGADGFAHLGNVGWPAALPTLVVFFLAMLAGTSRSSPFQTLALEVVPPERRGALAAIRNTFNQVGTGLGAALGGVIWARTDGSYGLLCLLAAGVTVAGVAALWGLVGDPI